MATEEMRRPTRHELQRWMRAEEVTGLEILARAGVEVPDVQRLSDRRITEKLWEVIRFLATRGIYFFSTDHLADRELYRRLTCEVLTGRFKDPDELPPELLLSPHTPFNYLDLGFGSSPEALETWLRYYAPDEDRAQLAAGGHMLPRKRPLPHDRDRRLPRPPSWERDTHGQSRGTP